MWDLEKSSAEAKYEEAYVDRTKSLDCTMTV